jgi:hypothetical protein
MPNWLGVRANCDMSDTFSTTLCFPCFVRFQCFPFDMAAVAPSADWTPVPPGGVASLSSEVSFLNDSIAEFGIFSDGSYVVGLQVNGNRYGDCSAPKGKLARCQPPGSYLTSMTIRAGAIIVGTIRLCSLCLVALLTPRCAGFRVGAARGRPARRSWRPGRQLDVRAAPAARRHC